MNNFRKIFFILSLLFFNFAPDLSAMSKLKKIFSCCLGCKEHVADDMDRERLDSGDFACLPDEMVLAILENFSDEDLMQASVKPVCKRTHRLVEYELRIRASKIAQRFIDQLLSPNINDQDLATLPTKFRTEFMIMSKKMEILIQYHFERLIRDLLDKEFKKQDCLKSDFFNKVVPAVGGKEFSLLESVVLRKIEAGDLKAKQIDNFIYQKVVNQQGIDFSDEIFKDLSEEQSIKIGDHILKMVEIIATVYFSKLLFMLLDLNVDGKIKLLFSSLKDLVKNVFESIYVSRSKDEFLNKLSLFHKKLSDFLCIDVVPLKIEIEELEKLFGSAVC